MLADSSNQPTIIRSSGGSTLKGTSKTTQKLVDTRRYVKVLRRSLPKAEHSTQTRRGVFQSDPILETLLGYYSSSGVMEPPPTEDPGPGNRPLGILAVVSAAVCYI